MAAHKKTRQKKVLIVEDEHPIAKTLELKLSNSGYLTLWAENGKTGLEALRNESVDLILLDLVMPEMDGFSMLLELKKQKKVPPIIILTNLGQDDDAKKCMDLGAREYFIKAETPLVDIVDYISRVIL